MNLTNKQKDFIKLLSGFLSALLPFLAIMGISFEWFNEDSINAFIFLVGALIPFLGSLYATWMNTFYRGEIAFKHAEKKRIKQEENTKVGL
ncbi:hypothetical protein E2R51_02400 [Jeotgalibacillus sp. S-D1]|uniref:hypothetical protein n=1 Tax=Jeotgalibacillus sp. S-D1 TaxID=2552189 RepID=UPI001059DFAB|nr:hypothetical protein [Jeotgalibacillus sp. S-D1]TDL34588.1 hypothetical protein E2R51_02400 [Jeotgalibacillus sp. S-D1]